MKSEDKIQNAGFLKNVLDGLDVGVYVLNTEGTVIYANNTLISGSSDLASMEELYSMNSDSMFAAGQSDNNIFRMVMEQKCPVTSIETIRLRNNARKVIITQIPVYNAEGDVEFIVAMMQDPLYYKEKYSCLEKSENHLYSFLPVFGMNEEDKKQKPLYASENMRDLYHVAEIAAQSDAAIMISGESGTGKEVLADFIHGASPRRKKKMVVVNCADMNENLLDSELFGYKKGAFTGALSSGKKGLIEEADGSTLFLDEINSMPLSVQAKLLRVIETHEIRPLGGSGTDSRKVNFRVIAATNQNLEQAVQEGRFREDLYYRLNILPLTIPPLRERKEDIFLLADYFTQYFGNKYSQYKHLSNQAKQKLLNYSWPGNVRELRNFIERLILMTDITVHEIRDISENLIQLNQIRPKSLPFHPSQEISSAAMDTEPAGLLRKGETLKEQTARLEAQLIEEALSCYGSYSKAAAALGSSKSTLIRKHKGLG